MFVSLESQRYSQVSCDIIKTQRTPRDWWVSDRLVQLVPQSNNALGPSVL